MDSASLGTGRIQARLQRAYRQEGTEFFSVTFVMSNVLTTVRAEESPAKGRLLTADFAGSGSSLEDRSLGSIHY